MEVSTLPASLIFQFAERFLQRIERLHGGSEERLPAPLRGEIGVQIEVDAARG
jgi:hypothetical protein